MSAVAINNRDQVLLLARDADQNMHSLLWEVGGDVTELAQYGTMNLLLATVLPNNSLMNDQGEVVVHRGSTLDDFRASLWHQGELTDLGTLGGDMTYATGVDEWGQVIGMSTDADGNQVPFLWSDGEMRPYDGLDAADLESFRPAAINNWGQVVGFGREDDGSSRPFLWQNGRFLDLGGLAQGIDSWRVGFGVPPSLTINDLGEIVAVASGGEGDSAVRWEVSPTWGYYPDGLP